MRFHNGQQQQHESSPAAVGDNSNNSSGSNECRYDHQVNTTRRGQQPPPREGDKSAAKRGAASSSSPPPVSTSMLLLVETIETARTLAINEYKTNGQRMMQLQQENETLRIKNDTLHNSSRTKDQEIARLRAEVLSLKASQSRVINQTKDFFDEGIFNCGGSSFLVP